MASPELTFSRLSARSPQDPLMGIFQQIEVDGKAWAETHAAEDPFIATTAVGAPHPGMLPPELNKRLGEAAAEKYGPGSLGYRLGGITQAANHYLAGRGVVFPDTVDTAVMAGGMEAINHTIRALIEEGEKVVIEAPGFTGTISGLKEVGADIIQIDMGKEGMTPDVLEAVFKEHRPKMVSLMPDCQNPTGAIMPLEHRKAIAALLQKYNVVALEDAAYTELYFDAADRLPPLQSFAPEHVIYVTSFSKILWPSIRMGYMVADPRIVKRASTLKFNNSMVASADLAAKAEMFLTLDDGNLAKDRLPTLRTTYAARYAAMDAALRENLDMSQWSWQEPQGGMFVYVTGPEQLDFEALLPGAFERGFAFVPGNKCYANEKDAPRNTVRLNFASTPEAVSALFGRRFAGLVKSQL